MPFWPGFAGFPWPPGGARLTRVWREGRAAINAPGVQVSSRSGEVERSLGTLTSGNDANASAPRPSALRAPRSHAHTWSGYQAITTGTDATETQWRFA
jgi:hypothetical protein